MDTEYWFIFQNGRLILTKDNELLSTALINDMRGNFTKEYPIGFFQSITCYSVELNANIELPENLQSLPLRKALDILDHRWYSAATRAASILNWDATHQFCGHCGEQTIYTPGKFEKRCPHCGLVFYPRISPSVIVLIYNGEEILMARSPHFTPGAYGLIAGFVEAGESLEDAIHREVKEEVNVGVKNIRYFDSQPWPFPDSLVVGFIAEYNGGELIIDPSEIEAAGWYHYSQLPGRPATKNSIATRLLDHFINQIIPTMRK